MALRARMGSPPGQEKDRAAEVKRFAVGTPVQAFEAAGFEVKIMVYPRGFTPTQPTSGSPG